MNFGQGQGHGQGHCQGQGQGQGHGQGHGQGQGQINIIDSSDNFYRHAFGQIITMEKRIKRNIEKEDTPSVQKPNKDFDKEIRNIKNYPKYVHEASP